LVRNLLVSILGTLAFAPAAQAAPTLSWNYVGFIAGADDIAVCDNGMLYALVGSGYDRAMVRTNSSVFGGSTLSGPTVYQERLEYVERISCSTDAGQHKMTSLWNTGAIHTQISDTGTGPDFTWPDALSPFTLVGFAADAADIKALGGAQVVAHNTDRYDYLGTENSATSSTTFSYLGDMWGAREIAVNGSGVHVAFAANDGWNDDPENLRLFVNRPANGTLSTFGFEPPAWEAFTNTASNRFVAYYADDMEAARVGNSIYLFVVMDGYVYRGTLVD
jgi:hypothetical protein